MYSRRKFAQDFKSGLRYGRGCSEVRDFLQVTLLVYLMKIQIKIRTSPQNVSILSLLIKAHPTKTVIGKNSTVLHREFHSLHVCNLYRRVFRPPHFFFRCTFTIKLLLDNLLKAIVSAGSEIPLSENPVGAGACR
jgi:hypothetical protein